MYPNLLALSQEGNGYPLGVTSTSGSSSNKGSWVQLSSGLAVPTFCFRNVCWGTDEYRYFFDLGIGSAGNEVVIAQDIMYALDHGYWNFAYDGFTFPLYIPPNVRIAVRHKDSDSSARNLYHHFTFDGGYPGNPDMNMGIRKVIAYGVGSNRGTHLTAPTVNYTYGAWTELSSGISEDAKGFLVIFSSDTAIDDGAGIWFSVGIGSSGNEEELVGWMPATWNYYGYNTCSSSSFYFIKIKSGTRVSLRYMIHDVNKDVLNNVYAALYLGV